jgi:hypothetical protein
MPRDPRLYLDDILEAIGQIQEYTASLDYGMFAQDRKTQDAVVRNLEIVGEAASRCLCDSEAPCASESQGKVRLLLGSARQIFQTSEVLETSEVSTSTLTLP